MRRGRQPLMSCDEKVSGAQRDDGDWINKFLEIVQQSPSAYRMLDSCFAAGTPMDTRFRSQPIAEIRKGDKIYAQ